MFKINKKTIFWSIIASFTVIIIMGGVLFSQRNKIIERIAKNKIASIERKKDITISFNSMHLEGVDEISIDSLTIKEGNEEPVVTIDELKIRLSLLGLFQKKTKPNKITIKDFHLFFSNYMGDKNFDFLKSNKDKNKTEESDETENDINQKFKDKIAKFFEILPDDIDLQNTTIRIVHNNYDATITIPSFTISNNRFNSHANLSCKGSVAQDFVLSGTYTAENHKVSCKVSSKNDNDTIQIPLIDSLFQAKVKFKAADFSFKSSDNNSDFLQLVGTLGITDLFVDYFRLSNQEINLGSGSLDYVLNLKNNVIELDSSSIVKFNQLSFNPYIQVSSENGRKYTVSINKPTFPADELFSSIPNGLFYNLDGIETTGDLDYHFYLEIDTANIDSLIFDSELNKHKNFKIVKFGNTDFRRINNEFQYDACDHGVKVRSFPIGPSWENFTPLDSNTISQYLQQAVMLSEDSYFMYHKGFYKKAFSYSMAQNIKQGRFARGGSTISMQLVKNLYLTNNKTLMRKIEEILIVWLIENEQLVSKKRLYEIYLNIIEWGPRIYGIKEASQYYFNKLPNQLSANEAIYLASIIPCPKHFMYRFDAEHKLKPYTSSYFSLLGNKMVSKGLLSENDVLNISKDSVKITGPAIKLLPKIEIKKDSLLSEPNDDNPFISIE